MLVITVRDTVLGLVVPHVLYFTVVPAVGFLGLGGFVLLVASQWTQVPEFSSFACWCVLLGWLLATASPWMSAFAKAHREIARPGDASTSHSNLHLTSRSGSACRWQQASSNGSTGPLNSTIRSFARLDSSFKFSARAESACRLLAFIAIAILGVVVAWASVANAAYPWSDYIATHVLTSFTALLFAAASVVLVCAAHYEHVCLDACSAQDPASLEASQPTQRRKHTSGCTGCGLCCCCSLLGLMFITCLCTWNALALSSYLTPPGAMIATPDNPTIHLYCSPPGQYDATKPTVLFLHGFLGSSLDAEWVRRDPGVMASRVRFCAIDRPGYGYSQNYFWRKGNEHLHFGKVAEIDEAVLNTAGVTGPIVFLVHSLGLYEAMALAHQVLR
jgi:hypothetical protein